MTAAAFACVAAAALAWPSPVRHDPTGMVCASALGFAVRLAPELIADPGLCIETLSTLRADLEALESVLPPGPLSTLRERTVIWIERQGAEVPGGMSGRGMVFHPSAMWLRTNGLDPERAGGVEIVRAEDYLAWREHQPMMVLHELAHAYHHLIGIGDERIAEAFGAATRSGRYDSVRYLLEGERRRAYGLNSPTEYFAELSEAYFGRNDYEPFDRAGLRAFDPLGYAVIESVWLGADSGGGD